MSIVSFLDDLLSSSGICSLFPIIAFLAICSAVGGDSGCYMHLNQSMVRIHQPSVLLGQGTQCGKSCTVGIKHWLKHRMATAGYFTGQIPHANCLHDIPWKQNTCPVQREGWILRLLAFILIRHLFRYQRFSLYKIPIPNVNHWRKSVKSIGNGQPVDTVYLLSISNKIDTLDRNDV